MTSKLRIYILCTGLIATFSVGAFAKKGPSNKVAVGTISSISNNQVVINEKVKGKDQPMTFKLDPSVQKSGNLGDGSLVTIVYHKDNNENVATAVRERMSETEATKKSSNKS